MMLGLILLPAGLLAASFATSTWHLYLSQGACVGAGVGFLYMPAMPIVSQWFDKKRSLANGICAAGSGIAGLIMCFVTQAMLDRIGLAWALRVTAIIAFTMNAVSTALMRSRNKDINPTQRMFDYRLLRRYEVILVLAWSFVMMFGYITLMFSLSDYTRAIGRSSQRCCDCCRTSESGCCSDSTTDWGGCRQIWAHQHCVHPDCELRYSLLRVVAPDQILRRLDRLQHSWRGYPGRVLVGMCKDSSRHDIRIP